MTTMVTETWEDPLTPIFNQMVRERQARQHPHLKVTGRHASDVAMPEVVTVSEPVEPDNAEVEAVQAEIEEPLATEAPAEPDEPADGEPEPGPGETRMDLPLVTTDMLAEMPEPVAAT